MSGAVWVVVELNISPVEVVVRVKNKRCMIYFERVVHVCISSLYEGIGAYIMDVRVV